MIPADVHDDISETMVAPLLGNCSWIALPQIPGMMLSRDFCFLHLPMHIKPGLLGFKILLCMDRIQDWSNPRKQLNINMSCYQICSMEVSSADSAASQHIPLSANHHRSRTNTSALPTTLSHAASML